MIAVVGAPAWRASDPPGPAGRACDIALAAAALGARVELVGRVGDDPPGDALLLALARASVGHVAVLRDPTRPTRVVDPPGDADDEDPFGEHEPAGPSEIDSLAYGPLLDSADVALGLRYLTAFSVLVVTDELAPAVLPAVIDAAAFAGARLIMLVAPGAEAPALPDDALVLEAPGPDDGAFGGLAGALAAGLDRGQPPHEAIQAATSAGGWEAIAGDT